MSNHTNIEQIKMHNDSMRDYIETIKNLLEKLHDEYFFAVPANYDNELLNEHLSDILNKYDYLTFAVDIICDAFAHIEQLNAQISENAEDSMALDAEGRIA